MSQVYDVTATVTVTVSVTVNPSGGGDDNLIWNADASTHDLTFNGVDEYLEVANSPDLDFGSGDFTVACWAKKLESSDKRHTKPDYRPMASHSRSPFRH